VHDAITRYRRALAEEGELPSVNGSAAAAGSGEARVADARIVGPDGDERDRFLAGQPFGLEVMLTGAAAAPRLHVEVRDGTGLLVAEDVAETAALGWDGRGGLALRFDVASPPLQFGRFEVTLALVGDDGRLLDRLARPLPLLVYPDDESRGLVRLEGTWRRGAKDGSA
jgi:hypothetical protein